MFNTPLSNGSSRHAPYARGRPTGQRMPVANKAATVGANPRIMGMSGLPMSNTVTTTGANQRGMGAPETPMSNTVTTIGTDQRSMSMSEMPVSNAVATAGTNQRDMGISEMPMSNTVATVDASQRATGMSDLFKADVDISDLNYSPTGSRPRQMYVTRPGSMSTHVNESLSLPEGMESGLSGPPSATIMTHYSLQGHINETRLPESMDRIADLMSQLVELHTKDLAARAETNELLKQLNTSTASVSQNTANILQSNASLSEQLSRTMNKLKAVDEFTTGLEGFMRENPAFTGQ